MIFLLPYRVDVLYPRFPWLNLFYFFTCIGVYVAIHTGFIPMAMLENMVLRELDAGFIAHSVVHVDFLHIFGNMLFLWVFGNAVCSKTGTVGYLALFSVCLISSAVAHLVMCGKPAIGASGVISGMVGCYAAMYPKNCITCLYMFILKIGTLRIPGWILLLFWFCSDLYGAYHGTGRIAYWAHIGGFVAGITCGLLSCALGLIDMTKYDHDTLVSIFASSRRREPVRSANRIAIPAHLKRVH